MDKIFYGLGIFYFLNEFGLEDKGWVWAVIIGLIVLNKLLKLGGWVADYSKKKLLNQGSYLSENLDSIVAQK